MPIDASMNVCNSTAYLNSVDQKTRFQIFNIPPTRYDNLANNPYVQINPNTGQPYTKYDLDMRRKAEILKYSSNRMATQTNSLTKAQIYSQAVNGSYQKRTYSQQFIQQNTVNGVINVCPPGVIIKTPSSASDVPGSPILLYDDPSIPLYNLINDTNTPYAIINQVSNPYSTGFNYSNQTDIQNNSPNLSDIFTLYFFNSSSPYYTFSFITSFSISFISSYLPGIINPASGENSFTVSINSISLNILYSTSTVNLVRTPTYILRNNTTLKVTLNGAPSAFNGKCYFDTVTFSNIILPVNLGYIYDYQLKISYNITPSQAYIQNYSAASIISYINATTPITPSLTNCSVSGNPVVSAIPKLFIVGNPVT